MAEWPPEGPDGLESWEALKGMKGKDAYMEAMKGLKGKGKDVYMETMKGLKGMKGMWMMKGMGKDMKGMKGKGPPGGFGGPAKFKNLEWTPNGGTTGGGPAPFASPAPMVTGFVDDGFPHGRPMDDGRPQFGQRETRRPAAAGAPKLARPDLKDEPKRDAPADSRGFCKFFGSARGCSNKKCPFLHTNPNSVPPCQFMRKTGMCDKGDACTYRHQPWSSPAEAESAAAERPEGSLEESINRYKQLHRGDAEAGAKRRLRAEHVEGVVEREMQVETYGTSAVKMMEKMGYKSGDGLGKNKQGNTKLARPCQALEQASQNCALGFGHFGAAAATSVAERAARLASARAQKRQKVEEATFFQHNLLSSDESSDGEAKLVKNKVRPLQTV